MAFFYKKMRAVDSELLRCETELGVLLKGGVVNRQRPMTHRMQVLVRLIDSAPKKYLHPTLRHIGELLGDRLNEDCFQGFAREMQVETATCVQISVSFCRNKISTKERWFYVGFHSEIGLDDYFWCKTYRFTENREDYSFSAVENSELIGDKRFANARDLITFLLSLRIQPV